MALDESFFYNFVSREEEQHHHEFDRHSKARHTHFSPKFPKRNRKYASLIVYLQLRQEQAWIEHLDQQLEVADSQVPRSFVQAKLSLKQLF